jgi:hypothetical protein
VYQLEGDIEGEKKLKIVVGGKSRWLCGRRGGCRCCSVLAMFASDLETVFKFVFPKHDPGTICALCITLFKTAAVDLPCSTPTPRIEHRDTVNGGT